MKSVLLAIGFILVLARAGTAQGDYVHAAKWLTWDHANPELVGDYYLYCDSATGVVPGPDTLITRIPATDPGRVTEVAEAAIIMPVGHYFCVVTAHSSTLGESLPSNEIELTVVDWTVTAVRVK